MGKENAILSFFKEQKVDYIYIFKDQIILFPCFECFEEVEMCTNTTNWKCSKCNNNGNLLILIRHLSKGNVLKGKLYNPTREKKKINLMMKELINENPDIKGKLKNIEWNINELLLYYKKKTT